MILFSKIKKNISSKSILYVNILVFFIFFSSIIIIYYQNENQKMQSELESNAWDIDDVLYFHSNSINFANINVDNSNWDVLNNDTKTLISKRSLFFFFDMQLYNYSNYKIRIVSSVEDLSKISQIFPLTFELNITNKQQEKHSEIYYILNQYADISKIYNVSSSELFIEGFTELNEEIVFNGSVKGNVGQTQTSILTSIFLPYMSLVLNNSLDLTPRLILLIDFKFFTELIHKSQILIKGIEIFQINQNQYNLKNKGIYEDFFKNPNKFVVTNYYVTFFLPEGLNNNYFNQELEEDILFQSNLILVSIIIFSIFYQIQKKFFKRFFETNTKIFKNLLVLGKQITSSSFENQLFVLLILPFIILISFCTFSSYLYGIFFIFGDIGYFTDLLFALICVSFLLLLFFSISYKNEYTKSSFYFIYYSKVKNIANNDKILSIKSAILKSIIPSLIVIFLSFYFMDQYQQNFATQYNDYLFVKSLGPVIFIMILTIIFFASFDVIWEHTMKYSSNLVLKICKLSSLKKIYSLFSKRQRQYPIKYIPLLFVFFNALFSFALNQRFFYTTEIKEYVKYDVHIVIQAKNQPDILENQAIFENLSILKTEYEYEILVYEQVLNITLKGYYLPTLPYSYNFSCGAIINTNGKQHLQNQSNLNISSQNQTSNNLIPIIDALPSFPGAFSRLKTHSDIDFVFWGDLINISSFNIIAYHILIDFNEKYNETTLNQLRLNCLMQNYTLEGFYSDQFMNLIPELPLDQFNQYIVPMYFIALYLLFYEVCNRNYYEMIQFEKDTIKNFRDRGYNTKKIWQLKSLNITLESTFLIFYIFILLLIIGFLTYNIISLKFLTLEKFPFYFDLSYQNYFQNFLISEIITNILVLCLIFYLMKRSLYLKHFQDEIYNH